MLSSPSGGGKSTLAKKISKLDNRCSISISTTTRCPRQGEVEGEDYFFVSKEKFENMNSENFFVEVDSIYGNYYGTSKKYVEDILESGNDIIFDINAQGNESLRKHFGSKVTSIYVVPPSIEDLEKRLMDRGDCSNSIKARLTNAKSEIMSYTTYDYLVVNKNIDESVENIMCIIKSTRLKLKNVQTNKVTQRFGLEV